MTTTAMSITRGAAGTAAPAAGLFGPGSMVWTVDRELAVLAGSGTRALLLQVAHPKIAAAVADHSRFRADPLGRLRGTLEAIYTFAFGDLDQATRTVERITRLHARITGTTCAGEPYSALDPDLLLWVYATLIDSSLLAYETFVAPLTAADQQRYYTELRQPGSLWGIPAERFPGSLVALRAWMADLITSGEVRVSEQGRLMGQAVAHPRIWWLPPKLALLLQIAGIWLLPAELRQGFGFSWGPRRERLMRTVAAISRRTVPHLPSGLRDLPLARRAERRAARGGRLRCLPCA